MYPGIRTPVSPSSGRSRRTFPKGELNPNLAPWCSRSSRGHILTRRLGWGTSQPSRLSRILIWSMVLLFRSRASAKMNFSTRFLKLLPKLVSRLGRKLPSFLVKFLLLKKHLRNSSWERLLPSEDSISPVLLPRIFLEVVALRMRALTTSRICRPIRIYLRKITTKILFKASEKHKSVAPLLGPLKTLSLLLQAPTGEIGPTLAKVGSLCPQSANRRKSTKTTNCSFLRSIQFSSKSRTPRLQSQGVRSLPAELIRSHLPNLSATLSHPAMSRGI